MKEWTKVFSEGISVQNPLTILAIGLCSALAVSTRLEGSFFMGLAVIFVLVMSNALISAIRHLVPAEVRIPIFIVVIATFVTIVDLSMKAFLPAVYTFLGVWIPLIVVNCIVLGRAEAFAYHNKISLSIADGLGMGLGFMVVISLLSGTRELFGSGHIQFLGATLIQLPAAFEPPSILVLFPGAFIVFGFIIAIQGEVIRRSRERAARKALTLPASSGEVA